MSFPLCQIAPENQLTAGIAFLLCLGLAWLMGYVIGITSSRSKIKGVKGK